MTSPPTSPPEISETDQYVAGEGPTTGAQIARVLIDSLSLDAADHKTLELIADHGPEQENLTGVFDALTADSNGSLDGVQDTVDLPVANEPEQFRQDLTTITAGASRNA